MSEYQIECSKRQAERRLARRIRRRLEYKSLMIDYEDARLLFTFSWQRLFLSFYRSLRRHFAKT